MPVLSGKPLFQDIPLSPQPEQQPTTTKSKESNNQGIQFHRLKDLLKAINKQKIFKKQKSKPNPE